MRLLAIAGLPAWTPVALWHWGWLPLAIHQAQPLALSMSGAFAALTPAAAAANWLEYCYPFRLGFLPGL